MRRPGLVLIVDDSHYPHTAIERRALESGVDVFLTKPCLPEDLETHVRRLLESKRR